MQGRRPPVWFERAVLPDLVAEVADQVEMLGPATDADPYHQLGEAEGALAGSSTYDAALMDHGPRLKVICRTGIGVDRVDLAAATERGIAVCNTPDGPTVSTAEHALALILAAAKNLKRSEAELRAGGSGFYATHDGLELQGRLLGLVGFGRIARHLAGLAAGFGMRVAAHDPYLSEDAFPADVTRIAEFAELLAAADVISVHVPLTDETRHLFDTSAFAAMRPDAVFVNTARGGIVDQTALLAALEQGRLFGAALDVTEPEPLPPDHPLLHRTDVIVTPHVASGTRAGKRRLFRMALAQVVDVLAGRRPAHLVNPEVWDRVAAAPGGPA